MVNEKIDLVYIKIVFQYFNYINIGFHFLKKIK